MTDWITPLPAETLAVLRAVGPIEAVLPDDPRGQPVPYYRGLVAMVASAPEGSCTLVTADGRLVESKDWPALTAALAAVWNRAVAEAGP